MYVVSRDWHSLQIIRDSIQVWEFVAPTNEATERMQLVQENGQNSKIVKNPNQLQALVILTFIKSIKALFNVYI